MNVPKQAQPIARQVTAQTSARKGIGPSSSCGCPNACIGVCVLGKCAGLCV